MSKRASNIAITRIWIWFFLVLMWIAFGGLGYRLVDLQLLRHQKLSREATRNTREATTHESRRGDIRDSRGNLLATSLFVRSVCANPSLIGPYAEQVASALASPLEMSAEELRHRLNDRVRRQPDGRKVVVKYKVLKHKVRPRAWERVCKAMANLDLGVNESDLDRASRRQLIVLRRSAIFADKKVDQLRWYPAGTLGSHVLGFVDAKHKGQEGIERAWDAALTGAQGWRVTMHDSRQREQVHNREQDVAARDGLNVVLTLDLGVQHIVEEELAKVMDLHQPVGALAVVVRPRTGAVLAMASVPTFDPNLPGRYSPDARRNRPVTDVHEPGSTFKIVAVSAALNERKFSLRDKVNCERGVYRISGRTLRDVKAYDYLTVEQIITKSSNIGAAKIGLRLGAQTMHQYIRGFGFGQATGIRLPGEQAGMVYPLNRWTRQSITSLPMGYELSATPMQMVMMMAAIANGGKLMRPMMVDRLEDQKHRVVVKYHPQAIRQVVAPSTAALMVQALKTVTAPGGTARRAKLEYFIAAGKTGTARKAGPGGYLPGKYYASFIGFFPADSPELCIYIAVDEPKESYYGGLVAAPVFRGIAERVAGYLGLRADPQALAKSSTRR